MHDDLPAGHGDGDMFHPFQLAPPVLIRAVPVDRSCKTFFQRRSGTPAEQPLRLLSESIPSGESDLRSSSPFGARTAHQIVSPGYDARDGLSDRLCQS